MKKILITGVAGFIGFHVFRALAGRYRVTGVDLYESVANDRMKQIRLAELGVDWKKKKAIASVGSQSAFHYCDIRNPLQVRQLFKQKPELVIHLAAMTGVRNSMLDGFNYVHTNIVGFYNILEAMRASNCMRILFASSSSVYGNNRKFPLTENQKTDTPLSVYAATKKCDELLAYSFCANTGISAAGLRLFTVYGPWGRTDMAGFNFMKNVDKGIPIKLYNRGNLKRDFTYVEDVVKIIDSITGRMLKEKNKTGLRIFNAGGAHPVKVADFLKTIERETGRKAIAEFALANKDEMLVTEADNKLLSAFIGKMKYTGIEKGIEQTARWYRENKSKLNL